MSRLKVYWPEDCDVHEAVTEENIIPIRSRSRLKFHQQQQTAMLQRARDIHKNRECPSCRHALIEPVTLNNRLMSRDNMPIPGSGVLVGFHCQCCHAEWPV